MSHIHTEPGQHDHTVSMYVIRTDFEEPRLMLHMHRKLNRYLQFGGHIELDETPFAAMTHEMVEEAGYLPEQLMLLQPRERLRSLSGAALHPLPLVYNTHSFPGGHFHTDTSYVFTTGEEPASPPKDGESKDIRLFTAAEIEALSSDEIIENVREIARYVLAHFQELEPVPFATFEQID